MRENPFFIGEFEGEGVRRDRHDLRALFACILGATLCAAALAFDAATHEPACRVAVVTLQGEAYTVGEGATFADAMREAVIPADANVYVVEGCDR